MKRITKAILLGSLFLSHSVYAQIPLSCQQHYSSDWKDYSDPRLSVVDLALAGTEGDDKSGTVKTFLKLYNGSISFDGFLASCTKLADGSLQIILKIGNEVSLNLITSDGTTFNVLPGSFLPLKWYPKEGPYVAEVKGPFVLTWQDGLGKRA